MNYSVRYGGRKGKLLRFAVSSDLVVVRSEQGLSARSGTRRRRGLRALDDFYSVIKFPDSQIEVLRSRVMRGSKARVSELRSALNLERGIRFVGKVLRDLRTDSPVIYTENLFLQFTGTVGRSQRDTLLRAHGLEIKRELPYATNGYFVQAAEGAGLKVFEIAESLLQDPKVALCHPELIRESRKRTIFPQQWHLKKTTVNGTPIDAHVQVEAAWEKSRGKGVVIAVIDDGIDIDHEEFRSPGKIVSPRDMVKQDPDPRPKFFDENHGTPCAGVACADGAKGASGVAPEATLMPIRLPPNQLGSHLEAEAFHWAADHGADIISCSWGPTDGEWSNDDDPLHQRDVPLPDDTRLAIEYAVSHGRAGKGCVITWAAGNGNESVDLDGYASNDQVIAVAACNDHGKRSRYSDKGKAVWCAFPSSDFEGNNGNSQPHQDIWTTDRSGFGAGLNPERSRPDNTGNYTDVFGGTSSACPGVAGVAALMLAVNGDLDHTRVKMLIKQCCDPIDTAAGAYDQDGHSELYGFGRINASKAVELAAAEPTGA